MNGQMYQIAAIVAASKKAIQSNNLIQYTPLKYENTTTFLFLLPKKFFRTKKYTAPNVLTWFEHLKKMGLQDIKLCCPYTVKNRPILGFSNTTESSILCFFKNRKITYFVADWQFDFERKQWNIQYTEYDWPNPPQGKPCFKNNTDSFRKVLLDIQSLAIKINCENFAHIFGVAVNLLDGSNEYPDENYVVELPQIPDKNLQLFKAASHTDVFGAMRSWNDSPPYLAHKNGLDKEYESLSDELLKNIRLAILYSINEW